MPRKSRELRLQQATALLEKYVSAGLIDEYHGRFIGDMCRRLERVKGLSKKQRDWLDSLIEEGAPTPKGDPELIAKFESVMGMDGMQHRRSVLSDFLRRIRNGWDLSEKQENFLNIMWAEADGIRLNGRWSPDEELIKKLQLAVQFSKAKNTWYWQHRPGTAKAYDKVNNWLEWSNQKEAREAIDILTGHPGFEPVDEPHIDEWVCNKLLQAHKKDLAEFDAPSHQSGSIRYHRDNGHVALVSGGPDVNLAGQVTYPCLVGGNLQDIPREFLLKRRTKVINEPA
tara:strand:+ start:1620 stop:2471 length:852 start_codon:yes stop_codon:yes gene_type:complete